MTESNEIIILDHVLERLTNIDVKIDNLNIKMNEIVEKNKKKYKFQDTILIEAIKNSKIFPTIGANFQFNHPHFLKLYGNDAYAFNIDCALVKEYKDFNNYDIYIQMAKDRLPQCNSIGTIFLYDNSSKPWESRKHLKNYYEKLIDCIIKYNIIY